MANIDYVKINQDVLNDILGSSSVETNTNFPTEEVKEVMPANKNIMVCDLWEKFADMDKIGKVDIGYASNLEEDREYGYVEIKDIKLTKEEQDAAEVLCKKLNYAGANFEYDEEKGTLFAVWDNSLMSGEAFFGKNKEWAEKKGVFFNTILNSQSKDITDGIKTSTEKEAVSVDQKSNVSLIESFDQDQKNEDLNKVSSERKLESNDLEKKVEESNVTSDGIEKDQKEQIKEEESVQEKSNKKPSSFSHRDIDVMKEDYLLAFLTSFYHQLKIKGNVEEIWASIRSNDKSEKLDESEFKKDIRIVTRIEDKDGNVSYNVCTKDNQAFTLDIEQHKDKGLKIDTFEVDKNSISSIEEILEQPNIALSKEDILKTDSELSKKAIWITTKDFEDENSVLKTEYSQLKNLDIPIDEIEQNINWSAIERNTGITKSMLLKDSNYERFIMGQETSIMRIKTPCGDDSNILSISTEGRLKLIRDDEGEYKVVIVDNKKIELLKEKLTSEQKEDRKKDNRYFISKNGQDYVIKREGDEVKIERLPNLLLEEIKNEYKLNDKELLRLRAGESLNIEYQTKKGKTKKADIALTNLSINNQTRQEAKDLSFKSNFALRIFNKKNVLPEKAIYQTEGAGVKIKRH